MNEEKEAPVFPILRGESVSEAGQFSGKAVIVSKPADLQREWTSDLIPVLHHDLESYFYDHPAALDQLFKNATAVVAEFGESIGQFAAYATQHSVIALVKVVDATYVLENDMHIRIVAAENQGDIFFID